MSYGSPTFCTSCGRYHFGLCHQPPARNTSFKPNMTVGPTTDERIATALERIADSLGLLVIAATNPSSTEGETDEQQV